jgi:hypothetical protein
MESTPYEDEEFNRVEMESRIKQEYIRDMKQPSREQLMAEVAVLTELVRVLSGRVAELEKGKEPLTCPICNATAYPYPKCGCVYYKEKNND